MKFAKRGERRIVQQHFDKDKIFVSKGGKTYNVYDAIQAANIDTDIVEVMKKYHMTEDTATKYMEERGGVKGIYTDLVELQNQAETLPDMLLLGTKAQEMFETLPADVKQKYGNNLAKFFEDMKKETKESEPQPQPKEVTDNEDK